MNDSRTPACSGGRREHRTVRCAHAFTAVLLAAAAHTLTPVPSHAQDASVAMRARALLDNAPIAGSAADSALARREFILSAAELLRQVPAQDRPPLVLRSALDAVRELEALLVGAVPVEVWSDPAGITLSYRRAVESTDAALVTAVTNDTLWVQPAWYDFLWREADGTQREMRINCTRRCRIVAAPPDERTSRMPPHE